MTLDRWLTRPRPPANLMEEVISIWHDEALTEHKFHGLARQYATRLKLSDRAVSLMIVAFKTLPSRPNAPCPRPLREHEWDELKDPLVRELGETSLLFRCNRTLFRMRTATLPDPCISEQAQRQAMATIRSRLGPKVLKLTLEYTKPVRARCKQNVLLRLAQAAALTDHEQWLLVHNEFCAICGVASDLLQARKSQRRVLCK